MSSHGAQRNEEVPLKARKTLERLFKFRAIDGTGHITSTIIWNEQLMQQVLLVLQERPILASEATSSVPYLSKHKDYSDVPLPPIYHLFGVRGVTVQIIRQAHDLCPNILEMKNKTKYQ